MDHEKTYIVSVDYGYGEFEYKKEIKAASVQDARKKWKAMASPSESRSFRVSDKEVRKASRG